MPKCKEWACGPLAQRYNAVITHLCRLKPLSLRQLVRVAPDNQHADTYRHMLPHTSIQETGDRAAIAVSSGTQERWTVLQTVVQFPPKLRNLDAALSVSDRHHQSYKDPSRCSDLTISKAQVFIRQHLKQPKVMVSFLRKNLKIFIWASPQFFLLKLCIIFVLWIERKIYSLKVESWRHFFEIAIKTAFD